MWLRLTERARKAVASAQSDAKLSADLVALACVRESGGLLSKVFAYLEVDVKGLRSKLEAMSPEEGDVSDEIIEVAEQEARGLSSPYVGPEHLFLGILRLRASQAARIAAESGVDYDRTKAAVASLMNEKALKDTQAPNGADIEESS